MTRKMQSLRFEIGTHLIGQHMLGFNLRSLPACSRIVYAIHVRGRPLYKIEQQVMMYISIYVVEDIETYMCTGCRSLKDNNSQRNYGIVPTVRIRNGTFIDDPENHRRVHYYQLKSTARSLIRREVITECNSLRRKTSYEPTGHIRRNIMASISKPDYGNYIYFTIHKLVVIHYFILNHLLYTIFNLLKRAIMATLAVGYDAGLDTLHRTIQHNRINPIQPLVIGNIQHNPKFLNCLVIEKEVPKH
uniref:Uncharacterized protein n=1 Tax=Heterorhabditis bacteriophora TaxID=37862 RepID=A0A1I7WBK3_HETBA